MIPRSPVSKGEFLCRLSKKLDISLDLAGETSVIKDAR